MQNRTLEPATFEIIRNALQAVCNEIGTTLSKVAYSPVVTVGGDFSGTIHTPQGFLVALGERDLPGLVGTSQPTLESILDFFPLTEIREGDVIFANIPHEGGTHLQDVRAYRAVFWQGEILAFVGDLVHWSDIGGATPGSFNPMAEDCFAEGLNIPPVKLVEEGKVRRDVLELILKNVRIPWETRGDIYAMIKGLEAGDRRLQALCQKYGRETLETAFHELFAYTERIFFHSIESLSDGSHYFEDRIDLDPLREDGNPVVIRLTFTKRGSQLRFDFSASDPDALGAVGCPRAHTCSGTYVGLLSLFPGIPFNHGLVRNLEIITKPGTIVHALFPSSVSGAAACAFEKVLWTVFGALGKADPSRMVACATNINNITVGGVDPRFDRPYVFYVWNEGGYGASAKGDAPPVPIVPPYAGGTSNQPVELLERRFPARFEEVGIDYESCGAGRFRGGPRIVHRFRITDGRARISALGDRGRFAPWGVAGGRDGGPHSLRVNPGAKDERSLGMFVSGYKLNAGDVVEIRSGGGGGYGDPLEREPSLVLRDVQERTLSPQKAQAEFGVVIEVEDEVLGAYRVDESATNALRARLRAEDVTKDVTY